MLLWKVIEKIWFYEPWSYVYEKNTNENIKRIVTKNYQNQRYHEETAIRLGIFFDQVLIVPLKMISKQNHFVNLNQLELSM
jgi:hypothetical protein